MPEFNGEGPVKKESLEDQKYREFQEALKAEGQIGKEMDAVFASTQDRAKAEEIVLETIAPRLNEAMAESRVKLDAWLELINKRD